MKKEQEVATTTQAQESITPERIDTSDWKTYRNEEYEGRCPPQLSILHQRNDYVDWHFSERLGPHFTPMRLEIKSKGSEPQLFSAIIDSITLVR